MASLPSKSSDAKPQARHARPRRHRRRWLIGLGVVVLVVLVVGGWAVDQAVGGSSASGPGHVLSYLSSGDIARADPDGTHAVPDNSIGFIGGGGVSASPDGQALVSGAGDIITLNRGRPVAHTTTLYGPISQHGGILISDQPFADGRAYVVFEQGAESDGPPNSPLIVATSGGPVAALGPGQGYVGDPQQEAAWVATPTGPPPTGSQEQADNGIDHRLPGGASTTLITADQLDTDLGLPVATALALYSEADPTGRYLMVGADRASTGQSAGAVIITRAGSLIAKIPVATDGLTSWSPSGSYLLVTSPGHASILSAAGQLVAPLTLPAEGQRLISCAWSPSDSQLACAGAAGRGDPVDTWLLIDRSKRTVTTHFPAGVPVLWTKN